MLSPAQVIGELSHQLDRSPILLGSLLEKKHCGEGLAMDPLRLEDRDHLPGEALDLGPPALPKMKLGQVEAGSGGVESDGAGHELPRDIFQIGHRLLQPIQPRRDKPLKPATSSQEI